jgi:redox-sensitive bicupin YhaK (pirin superfamily)
MKKSVLHKASTRGHANHGWLDSYHTFSFAEYYQADRIHFGTLRVLNDDIISGGMGFGLHPHKNMEIISIPIEGAVRHQDNMGNASVIEQTDVQVMSAGTGIYHSEYNNDAIKPAKFLQIWVFPEKDNLTPRYDQKSFNLDERHNKLQLLVSPDGSDNSLWIHQNAWFSRGTFEQGRTFDYAIRKEGNGVYLFVISGKVTVDEQELERRDGLGISNVKKISVRADIDAEVLLMDLPM